jgi:hypothetical protein
VFGVYENTITSPLAEDICRAVFSKTRLGVGHHWKENHQSHETDKFIHPNMLAMAAAETTAQTLL